MKNWVAMAVLIGLAVLIYSQMKKDGPPSRSRGPGRGRSQQPKDSPEQPGQADPEGEQPTVGQTQPLPDPAPDAPWGEAMDGIQARLRASDTTWMLGEEPLLRADLRNIGQRKYLIQRGEEFAELLVAGERYRGAGPAGTPRSTVNPGECYYQMGVPVSSRWRVDGVLRSLKLRPGRHDVRVAFAVRPADDLGEPVRVVSNPVQLTIERGLPGSATALQDAIRNQFAFVAVCQATGGTDGNDAGTGRGGEKKVQQPMEAVEILAGRMLSEYAAEVRFDYTYIIARHERGVAVGEKVIWICMKGPAGEAIGLKALRDTEQNRKAVQDEVARHKEGGGAGR